MVKKEVAKRFSCLKCGTPFEAYPPDDRHGSATRNEKEYEDHTKVDYRCKECGNINTMYWGNPPICFRVGSSN
jgi:DNA-directed RNA polymerase subunit RPC12/RpoP